MLNKYFKEHSLVSAAVSTYSNLSASQFSGSMNNLSSFKCGALSYPIWSAGFPRALWAVSHKPMTDRPALLQFFPPIAAFPDLGPPHLPFNAIESSAAV